MAASSEEFRTLKAAGLVWRAHRLEIPLGSILLSQPRHLLAAAPSTSVDSTKARKQPVPCKGNSNKITGASSTSDLSMLTEEPCEAQPDHALLLLAGLSVRHSEGPILDPAPNGTSVNPFIGNDAPESLWGGVSTGASDLMAHTVSVVSLDRCDHALRRELTDMHAKTRDRHSVADALSGLQSEESGASAVAIYAALDGAKVVMRALKKTKAEGRASTSIPVVLYSPVVETAVISKAEAFELAFRLNRVAQNSEAVSAIELVKAGSLVLNRTFEDVYRQQQRGVEPEILQKSVGVTAKTSRRRPLSEQLDSLFLSRRPDPTFSQTLSFELLRRVFEKLGTASSASSSHVFVEAAISGHHLLDIDTGGGNPTASGQFWARPSSGGEVDSEYEKRLQFLSGFRMACSRAQNNADDGKRISESSMSETQSCSQDLVDKAINDLFAVDGGASDSALDSEHVGGSSLTRTEANHVLTLTAVLMPKPASQAIWAFGHRYHPAAAKVAFHHETLLGSSSRQLRGLAKRTAKDFESFIALSVVLSLAREAQSAEDDEDVTFRKSWSTKAFKLASSFCELFARLDGLFQDGRVVTQMPRKPFDDMIEGLVEIVKGTQTLEKELGRTLLTQPATVSDMPSAAGASEASLRPVELQSTIPAIDAVWECLWENIQEAKKNAYFSYTMVDLTLTTAVSKIRALPDMSAPAGASDPVVALPVEGHAGMDPEEKSSQGNEKRSEGEGDKPVSDTHAAGGGGEKEDDEPVAEVDATEIPVPAPMRAPPVSSNYGLRLKENKGQTFSGTVGRGWRRSGGGAIKKRTTKGPASRGPRLVVHRRQLGKALYQSTADDRGHSDSAGPAPPVQPAEKLPVADTTNPSRLSISTDAGKEGKLGFELGDFAQQLLEKDCLVAFSMLGASGSVLMESVPTRDSYDEEGKEEEHNSLAESDSSPFRIPELFQKRATLFSSLALSACHAVVQSAENENDAVVEGTFNAPRCCEKWAETFGEGDAPTIRVQLRKNGPSPGVYATGGKSCGDGDKEEGELDDSQGTTPGWVKLLEPEITSPLGLEQTDAVVFTHTDAYEAICPHHTSAASFLTEYLRAFLFPKGSLLRWGSTDPTDGAGMQRPRFRIVLPRKVIAAPPKWNIYEALFPCKKFSIRSLRDLPEFPPGVGLLACPPEERLPTDGQGKGMMKVYWNIFGRWPTEPEKVRRTGDLQSEVGEQLATCRPDGNLAEADRDILDVCLVGSLSTWNLIHALARGRKFSPGEFHDILLGTTSSDGHSIQENQDPAQVVMDVLQFSEVERATVRRFLELQGGNLVKEEGMLSLGPGDIGIVHCKIPDVPLRDESPSGPLSSAGSGSHDPTGETDFGYLCPTFVTTL